MPDLLQLSPASWETLGAVCDTLITRLSVHDDPTGFWGRAASDLGVPAFVAEAIKAQLPNKQAQFRRLLDLPGAGLVDFPRAPSRAATTVSVKKCSWVGQGAGLVSNARASEC